MDPINKWLTVIIGFMLALLIIISWKAGSGRYEFSVQKSTLFSNHAVVYVLDTKNGDVRAKLVSEDDLHNRNTPLRKAIKVFEIPPTLRYQKY